MLRGRPDFNTVGTDFWEFLREKVDEYEQNQEYNVGHIVFVAHCGRLFDIPFLMR
jgi:hypothetical protein